MSVPLVWFKEVIEYPTYYIDFYKGKVYHQIFLVQKPSVPQLIF